MNLEEVVTRKAVQDNLVKVELKAAEILNDKQEIIALDKKRNDCRVGMRAIQKEKSKSTWMVTGPMLIKMPNETAEELLKREQNICSIEIEKLRSNLKVKVNELRDLEYVQPVPGLMLKPIDHKEMTALKEVLELSS